MSLRSFLFFGLLFFYSPAKSDIYTPVTLNLTLEELSEILNRHFKEGIKFEGQVENVPQIPGFIQQEIDRASYEAEFLPKISIHRNGEIFIEIHISKFLLELKDFHISYLKNQETDSSLNKDIVDIKCETLQVSLNKEVSYKAQGTLNTNPPEIWELEIPEQLSFEVESQNCEGPMDLKELISEHLIKWSSSEEGQRKILEALNTQLIEFYWGEFKNGLEMNLMGRKFYISILNLSFDDSAKAEVMIRWPNNSDFLQAEESPSSKAVLSMSSEGFNSVLKKWLSQSCYEFSIERKDIPTINALFESKTKKFIVWRDLNKFKADTNFKLDIKVCPQTMEIKNVFSQEIKIHHKSNIRIEMSFLNNNSVYPYMLIWTESEGNIDIKSEETGLNVGLSNTQVDFQSQFHPQMSDWRKSNPYSGPNFYFLESHIVSGLESLSFSMLKDYQDIFRNRKFYMDGQTLEFR